MNSRHKTKFLVTLKGSHDLAVKWSKGKTFVSYIYKKDDSLLSPRDIIILKGHKNPLPDRFRRNLRSIELLGPVRPELRWEV